MRPHVVYLLGAGFSAPLGLPVVANFLSTARDLYADEPKRFASFQPVFDLVKHLSYAKNFFQTDLANIEEVLSLLELGEFADRKPDREQFVRFLSEVIHATTPSLPVVGGPVSANWEHHFLSQSEPWRGYAYFVASLRSLQFAWDGAESVVRETILNPPATYSVVSLNYDVVLELASSLVDSATKGPPMSEMSVVTTTAAPKNLGPVVAKLHGSVHDNSIVPPTWNKGSRVDLSVAWKEALGMLRAANYIRVLGYSLPETDSYVRYLLKFAAAECEHLKGIDVVCLDSGSVVHDRYASFVLVPMRFATADIVQYLGGLTMLAMRETGPKHKLGPLLEMNHDIFMRQYASALPSGQSPGRRSAATG